VVDADQDWEAVGDDGPVGCLQTQVGNVGVGAGQDGGHGAGMGGVGVVANVGDGGCRVVVSSLVPVAGPSGPATGVCEVLSGCSRGAAGVRGRSGGRAGTGGGRRIGGQIGP
jgi:hypothetical protein